MGKSFLRPPFRLIISDQHRRGLTPKLMSYMSATAGCDRKQSEALNYNSMKSEYAKPHQGGVLHRHSFELAYY